MPKIVIAEVFTRTPGPRNQDEGDFSGERFLKEHLEPGFLSAQATSQILLVDLDGAEGYATSFLEAAFGGLARKYSAAAMLKTLQFKSDEEPYLIDEIQDYVKQASA